MMIDCTLLILTYNNVKNLELMLPTVKSMLSKSQDFNVEVQIIQNGDCAVSKALVNNSYAEYNYVEAENNFLFSYNPIVSQLESKTIFILNDDLKLSDDILNLSLPLFEGSNLFAVSCLFYNWGTKDIQLSGSEVKFSGNGMKLNQKKEEISEIEYCFLACGGASIYRTEMFNALNGFDEIYYPAYYEDTDLSHRAWQRGWASIVHPKAWVEHRSGESWKSAKKKEKLLILQVRNKLFGSLVNYHSNRFLINFIISFPYRFVYSFLFQKVFNGALRGVFVNSIEILRRRKQNKKTVLYSNEWMLEKIGKPYKGKN